LRSHLDTADTFAILNSKFDVAFVSPGSVPGIFDEPVFFVTLLAPADDEDGMVELGAALSRVHDARLVSLENFLVSLNSDSKGLLCKSTLHLVDVSWHYILVLGDFD